MRLALALCVVGLLALAAPAAVAKPAGSGLTASVGEREVDLAFAELHKPTVLYRDGAALATLPRGATAYADRDVGPGGRYSYALGAERVDVELPAYLVGAATADITPSGPVNLGGFGLGDGSVVPDAIIGRGGFRGGARGGPPPPAGGLRRRQHGHPHPRTQTHGAV